MNSGIGDKRELAALGIASLVHLPDVGKNLSDHLLIANNWHVKGQGKTYDEINRNASLTNDLIAQWKASHKGPLVDTLASHLVYSRVPKNDLRQFRDPAAGPNTAHIELAFSVRHLPWHDYALTDPRFVERLRWRYTLFWRVPWTHIFRCEPRLS